MSYLDAPSDWRNVKNNARKNVPRILLLGAISLAWMLTLAWPPPAPRPLSELAETSAPRPGYPLRVALPESIPIEIAEFEELVEENKQIAELANAELEKPELAGPVRTSDSQAFSDAFRDLDRAPASKPQPELEPGEFLDVDYNIAELDTSPEKFNRSDGSLTVEKPLFVDGVNAGPATIRIEEGAQILIATASVAQALGDKANALPNRIAGALASGTGFIPFYELRGAGIAVEYDPIRDRVSLSTKS